MTKGPRRALGAQALKSADAAPGGQQGRLSTPLLRRGIRISEEVLHAELQLPWRDALRTDGIEAG